MLSVTAVEKNWSSALEMIADEYNHQRHSTTGFAPMELESEDEEQYFVTIPGLIMPKTEHVPLEEKRRFELASVRNRSSSFLLTSCS